MLNLNLDLERRLLLCLVYLKAESAAEVYSLSVRARERVTGNLGKNISTLVFKIGVQFSITL